MDLVRAKEYLLRTHLAAISRGERANAYCLTSSPGVGKTEVAGAQQVEALAVALNQPVGLVIFRLASLASSGDVLGFMIPTKNPSGGNPLTTFSQPPWMPRDDSINVRVCEPTGDPDDPVKWYGIQGWSGDLPRFGVLLLDEWGQGEDDVKKPAAELLLNGRVGDFELQQGWRVLAATNRMSDRSGVLRELMFIVNRRGLMVIDAQLDPWLGWVETQRDYLRPHYLTVSFARAHPGVVFKSTVPDGTDQFCTPRSLVLMDKDLRGIRTAEQVRSGELMEVDDPLTHECIAMWIGQGAAGQYLAHLRFWDQLPDIADIVKDPMTAKLPRGQDGQMVCAFKLVESINEDNAGVFMRYIGRMHQDMGVLAVTTINKDPRRAKYVYNLSEYRDYVRKNKDVLIAAHS